MYFILLTIEKLTGFHNTDKKHVKPFLWVYSMFFVVLGWVIFRAASIDAAISYIATMFGKNAVFCNSAFGVQLRQVAVFLLFGIVFSFPITKLFKPKRVDNVIIGSLFVVIVVSLFIASVASIVSSSYNPFIYFNF